ncbi:hypothetical protein LTR85_011047 [Meristemomyces frigidus]|nr:hypothetical protein LTR85_011047 [Meristemomyces frigidus]
MVADQSTQGMEAEGQSSQHGSRHGGGTPTAYLSDYVVTSRGTKSQGNRYDTRQYSVPGSDATCSGYHYSNLDGSYYYYNPDGSSYYDNGRGGARYTRAHATGWEKRPFSGNTCPFSATDSEASNLRPTHAQPSQSYAGSGAGWEDQSERTVSRTGYASDKGFRHSSEMSNRYYGHEPWGEPAPPHPQASTDCYPGSTPSLTQTHDVATYDNAHGCGHDDVGRLDDHRLEEHHLFHEVFEDDEVYGGSQDHGDEQCDDQEECDDEPAYEDDEGYAKDLW